jgi:hypothetical protein
MKDVKTISSRSGFTLVETVVSSAILVLAVIAMCTMLRKGKEIEIGEAHYQRARAIIDSCFESRIYGSGNYDLVQPLSSPVIIDDRNGVNIGGVLEITVSGEQTMSGYEGVLINYKEISGTVTWNEPEGQKLFTVSKRITRL